MNRGETQTKRTNIGRVSNSVRGLRSKTSIWLKNISALEERLWKGTEYSDVKKLVSKN